MFTHLLSFGAGFASGWMTRSMFGSTREAVVRVLTLSMATRERVRRVAAEQVEWWEDMIAEAKSRVRASAQAPAVEADTVPLRPRRVSAAK